MSHIEASKHYRLLGYPDLAAGTAYKALLLSDALNDESDEYHDAAIEDLNEFISGLDSEHQYRSIQTQNDGSTESSDQNKLISVVLEEQQPLM